jgi:hypothetical protein
MKSHLKTLMSVALAATVVAAAAPAFAQGHKHATHLRHAVHEFGQSYGYVPYETPASRGLYESYSTGRQSFPNPDRDFDGPNTHNEF